MDNLAKMREEEERLKSAGLLSDVEIDLVLRFRYAEDIVRSDPNGSEVTPYAYRILAAEENAYIMKYSAAEEDFHRSSFLVNNENLQVASLVATEELHTLFARAETLAEKFHQLRMDIYNSFFKPSNGGLHITPEIDLFENESGE